MPNFAIKASGETVSYAAYHLLEKDGQALPDQHVIDIVSNFETRLHENHILLRSCELFIAIDMYLIVARSANSLLMLPGHCWRCTWTATTFSKDLEAYKT